VQSIATVNHIKNNIKYPFLTLAVIIILCTLFIFSGHQSSVVFKGFILIAIVSIITTFFYNWLIGIMVVLIFINIENFHYVYKNIKGNYNHNTSTSLDERRAAAYNHMEYKFLKNVVTRLTNVSIFPTLYYPNYDFGVRALLPGYRNQISPEILGVMDLDATMLNVSGLSCGQTIQKNTSRLSCELKEIPDGAGVLSLGWYVITGIQFDSALLDKEEYEIIIKNNETLIDTFSFSIDDIFNTKMRSNLIKFHAEEIILPNFNKSVSVYKPIITKDLIHGDTLEIIVNGKSVPNFNLSGYLKVVPEHLIIEWDTYDAGSYIAIKKSALSSEGRIIDETVERVINDILSISGQ
jgi:hypothetical protein